MSRVQPNSVPVFASAVHTATQSVVQQTYGASGLIAVIDCTTLAAPGKQINTVDRGTSTGGTFTLTYGAAETSALAWNISAVNLDTAVTGLTGVSTATVTGTGAVAVSEVSTVDTGAASGGTFTITVGGQTTATPIAFDALASVVETGVESLSTVTDATVTGGPVSEIATIDVGTSSGGTWTLTVGANTSAAIAWNATAATVKTALELLASVTTATVTGNGTPGTPWAVAFTPFEALTVSGSGASLTGGNHILTVTETAIGAPAGTAYVITFVDPVTALAVSGTGTSLTPSDTLTVAETVVGVTADPWVITIDTPTQIYAVSGDGALLTGGDTTLTVVETQTGIGVVSVVFSIDMPDGSGKDVTILDSAAITATGTTVLRVSPHLTASANTIAKDLVPNALKWTATHNTADNVTYTVNAHYLA